MWLICQQSGIKQTISLHFFSIFELGCITKHLLTGPVGNSEFCFSSASMFSSELCLGGSVEGLRKTKLSVYLWLTVY